MVCSGNWSYFGITRREDLFWWEGQGCFSFRNDLLHTMFLMLHHSWVCSAGPRSWKGGPTGGPSSRRHLCLPSSIFSVAWGFLLSLIVSLCTCSFAPLTPESVPQMPEPLVHLCLNGPSPTKSSLGAHCWENCQVTLTEMCRPSTLGEGFGHRELRGKEEGENQDGWQVCRNA